MWSEDKRRDLELAISQIERQYGKGSIMRMGEGAGKLASVVSAVASALLTLSVGFRFVMLVGAACYALSTLLVRQDPPAMDGTFGPTRSE